MKNFIKTTLIGVFVVGSLGAGYFLLLPKLNGNNAVNTLTNKSFGWKFPKTKIIPTNGNIATLGLPPLFDVSINPGSKLAYSSIRDPGGVPRGLPVRLKIPVIGVDSAIEDALITSDGRMDVPIGSVNVAWFSLGPHPGQVGSAVIGGHFGITGGVPFVFYNLDKLKVGDKVYVLNDKGETLAFIARSVRSFDRNADSSPVFTSTDGLVHLNLITCEGIWNQVNGTYPQRLVVFTDAIPSEGSVVVNPKTRVTAKAKLPSTAIIPSPTPVRTADSNVKTTTLFSQPATWVDGLITSLLIISIFFMAFKIIKR